MSLDYQALIDKAMLDIVRKILLDVQDNGLDINKSLYISFKTNYPEIILSKHVHAKYPEDITIVIQHQYKDLRVLEDRFSINICFGGIAETIEVPFASLTNFADPIEDFNLQFKMSDDLENLLGNLDYEEDENDNIYSTEFKPKKTVKNTHNNNLSTDTKKEIGQIISIDKFRKKK